MSSAIDLSRFKRIPGPKRHYVDRQTGREVSYTTARRKSGRRASHTPQAIATRQWAIIRQRWQAVKGTPARGSDTDPAFKTFSKKLRKASKFGSWDDPDAREAWNDLARDEGLITSDSDDLFAYPEV